MSQFTDFAKECLVAGRTPEGVADEDNPFEKERGASYHKFDMLTIVPATDGLGGTLVKFGWHGRDISSMRVGEGESVVTGALYLYGIEGRQGIRIDRA